MKLADFDEVWCADFEFHAPSGERPIPICMVAIEIHSGRTIRLFGDEMREPPFGGSRSLFVSYYASAELGCYLALGWPLPTHILDLFVEFRNITNGLETPAGSGLLGALVYFGLDSMAAVEKQEMRDLSTRGFPFTNEERAALLLYCAKDALSLPKLLDKMLPQVDLPRALLRGRYMAAAARMEYVGVPVDIESHQILVENWQNIQDQLIEQIDADYGVFDGRTFKADRFARWLAAHDIPWPRLESGNLALDDDTFREMSRVDVRVAPLRELRVSLSQMRLSDLAIGSDGRNRTLLSAFRARSGRNQPSSVRFIFGPAVWLRSLIKPEPETAVIYCDWCQQEFGIGAALSGDTVMWEAYSSTDPYLSFAKQAHAVPPHATKVSHGRIREQFKACALAVQYGMGAESLALRIGSRISEARDLLRLHRETYRTFWKWSDAAVDRAMLFGKLHTVFGWQVNVDHQPIPGFCEISACKATAANVCGLHVV